MPLGCSCNNNVPLSEMCECGYLLLCQGDLIGASDQDIGTWPYKVVSTCGVGTFAQVVECEDTRFDNKRVAIKITRHWPVDSSYRIAVKCVVGEINTLKRCNELSDTSEQAGVSVPIVQMLDTFTFKQRPCIVMELLDCNAYSALRKHMFAGLPWQQLVQITKCLLKAIDVLHDAGIVHADIKPENIMFTKSDNTGDPIVKLGDFGLSYDETALSSSMAFEPLSGYIQSRFYRAPEVSLRLTASENTLYTRAIDIWSLGCVVFELFNGQPLTPASCLHDLIHLTTSLLQEHAPKHMIDQSRCKNQLYSVDGQFINWLYPQTHWYPYSSTNRTLHNLLCARSNISSQQVDLLESFLKHCLCWDPADRWTVKQLMAHPFVTE